MREHKIGYAEEQVAGSHQRFEYLIVTVEPHENLKDARARLLEHSEYGRWELARSVILYGGRRKYWLRRRVMKLQKTVHFV